MEELTGSLRALFNEIGRPQLGALLSIADRLERPVS